MIIKEKYWVLWGPEQLGVTDEIGKVEDLLKDAYLEENGLPESDREALGVRVKFDQIRLTKGAFDVKGFYAENAKEL